MDLLAWIVVGLIAGWLAGVIVKGGGYGIIGDIILGIVGALVGGFLASFLLGMPSPLTGINITTIIVAIIGAIIVVFIFRALAGARV